MAAGESACQDSLWVTEGRIGHCAATQSTNVPRSAPGAIASVRMRLLASSCSETPPGVLSKSPSKPRADARRPSFCWRQLFCETEPY
jgi:hypothetical protein